MSSLLNLYCPYCEGEFTTLMIEVGKFQTVTCKSCHKPFNLFTIYKTFYEEIPIAKRIADIWTKAIYKNYKVEGLNEDDINRFFEQNNFHKLFPQIVLDCNIYGNSFVKYTNKDGLIELTRIEPAFANVSTIPKGFDQLLDITTHKGDHINPDELIHFTIDITIDPPFCDPVFGLWFDKWYPLKLSPQSLISASILKNRGMSPDSTNNIEKIREYFKREVILGSGLPSSLFTNDLNEEQIMVQMTLFRHEVQSKRSRLQDTVERKIFSLVLNKKRDLNNFPEFIIQGLV
jgi:hypothetical protein